MCHPLPEVAVAAVKAAEFGQLGAGEIQRHTDLEADQHGLGDEIDDPARAQQPGHEASADTSKAVAAASAPKRPGSPPASGASEEPTSSEIAEVTVTAVCRELVNIQKTRPGEDARIKPGLRREPGQRCIADARGNQIGRERDARHDIARSHSTR